MLERLTSYVPYSFILNYFKILLRTLEALLQLHLHSFYHPLGFKAGVSLLFLGPEEISSFSCGSRTSGISSETVTAGRMESSAEVGLKEVVVDGRLVEPRTRESVFLRRQKCLRYLFDFEFRLRRKLLLDVHVKVLTACKESRVTYASSSAW